jgi:hypothetical protein
MTKVEKRDEFLASEVKGLVLEVGYAECAVVEIATETVTVEAVVDAENADKYFCSLENGVLQVEACEANKKISLTDKNRSAIEKQEVTIYVPCGMKLDTLELSVGAGTARLKNASTVYGKADIEVGAGKLEAVALNVAGNVSIEVGAGNASIANLTAATADIECGVGKMSVKGAVAGDCNIECGVGNIEMYLDAAESDYNYDIDCGIGSVYINGSKRGGLLTSSADMAHAGARGTIKLQCGIGKIELITQKRIA